MHLVLVVDGHVGGGGTEVDEHDTQLFLVFRKNRVRCGKRSYAVASQFNANALETHAQVTQHGRLPDNNLVGGGNNLATATNRVVGWLAIVDQIFRRMNIKYFKIVAAELDIVVQTVKLFEQLFVDDIATQTSADVVRLGTRIAVQRNINLFDLDVDFLVNIVNRPVVLGFDAVFQIGENVLDVVLCIFDVVNSTAADAPGTSSFI